MSPSPPSQPVTSTGPVVRVEGLRMRYGALDVLDDVTFHVGRGEVVALLGPNGAGKTTTIEVLEGFRARSAGHVEVLGVDPADADEAWKARIGIVLQSWRDHARWSPRQLLGHLGEYYASYSTEQRPKPWPVDELLDLVGLTSHADRRIVTFSGGQRRRLDVAVGIVGRPDVLFLDEPTAGFDPEARREFHELVHRLSDLEETSVLLTTHDLDEADRLADRLLILAGGRIIAAGSPDELSRQVAARVEVRWARGDTHYVDSTDDGVGFVRRLLAEAPDITDLQVRRPNLEDTYIALVQQYEAGGSATRTDATPLRLLDAVGAER